MNMNRINGTGTEEHNYFIRRMFRRQYMPALISALTLSLGDMADAIVLGRRMGEVGLAAMSFALPIFMIYNVIMHSFGLGGSMNFSRHMAAGHEEKARADFQGVFTFLIMIGAAIAVLGNLAIQPILFVLGAGESHTLLYDTTAVYVRILLISAPLFFSAYSLGYYMRNSDMEREAGIAASIGNIVDIILNVVLVFFLRMGAAGAGIATLAGVALTSAIEIVVIRCRKNALRLLPFKPDYSNIWKCFRTGFSTCVSYLYKLVFVLLCNNIIIRLAGEEGVAVFDVIQNLTYFFSYIYGAVTQAVQPILSTYSQEYNHEACDLAERKGFFVGMITGLAVTALVGIFAPQVCALFGLSPENGGTLGIWAIRIFCTGTLLTGINHLWGEFSLARGQSLPTFVLSTLRGAAVLIPLTLLCSQFGARFVWIVFPLTEAVSLAIFLLWRKLKYVDNGQIEPERVYRAFLHNQLEEIGTVTEQIEAFCERWEATPKQHYYVQMTVEELCNVIMTKGFQGKEADDCMIQISLVAGKDGKFTLHLRDSSDTFNPFAFSADKTDGEEIDFNEVGMQVIKKRAESFYYRRYQEFNTMVVTI